MWLNRKILNLKSGVSKNKIDGKFSAKIFHILWLFWSRFFYSLNYLISFYTVRKIRLYDVNTKYKISFCITCRDRAFHIKQTLEKNIIDNLDYDNLEFVLLDYNSEDDLQEFVFSKLKKYIDSGILKYYKTNLPTSFNMANAKNNAHYLAIGDIVCNLDADNYTGKDFAFYINYVCNKNEHPIGSSKEKNLVNILLDDGDFGGRIFMFKRDFLSLGGYDESFVYWGFDDNDIYNRAVRYGLKSVGIPLCFLRAIRHKNNIRNINDQKNIHSNKTIFDGNNESEVVKVNVKLLEDVKLIN